MKLKKQEVEKLASLSKIALSDKEVEKFTNDMGTIIDSVKTLDGFDCKNEIKSVEIAFSELREDKISQSMNQKDALANAPHVEDGYFKVYGEVFDENSS